MLKLDRENKRIICDKCFASIWFKNNEYGPRRIIELPTTQCGKHIIEVKTFTIILDGVEQ